MSLIFEHLLTGTLIMPSKPSDKSDGTATMRKSLAALHGKCVESDQQPGQQSSLEPNQESGTLPAQEPVQKPAQENETGGPTGPEPTRYGDWERKGRCIDF